MLHGLVGVPVVAKGSASVWANYTVVHPGRDGLRDRLRDDRVATAVYYGVPVHRQPPYQRFPHAPGGLPVTERLAGRVLSLPLHPYLDEATQDRVVQSIRRAVSAEL